MRVYFVEAESRRLIHFSENASRGDFQAGDQITLKVEMHGREVEFVGVIVGVRHQISALPGAEETHSLAIMIQTH